MWYRRESTSSVEPSRIQENETSVFLRRNITFVEESMTDEGEIIQAHYEWEEMVMSKDIWVICSKFIGHDEALDDVYAALTELAEIITEG